MSTETWESAVGDLRRQFVADAEVRAGLLRTALSRLSEKPEDEATLREVLRHFHGFAGSGTTFGFPRVTSLGRSAERTSQQVLRERRAPTGEELSRLNALLGEVEVALSKFPAAEAPAEAEAELPRPVVLLVDDDAADRVLLQRSLALEGFAIREAKTRQDAIAVVESEKLDGLVVDLHLRDGTAYELIEYVRDRPGGDASAIVVVSGAAEFVDKVEAIHCGADAYFDKSVDGESLARRLHTLLDRRKVEPLRILSVEDDASQGAFVKRVLSAAGYEVRVLPDPDRFEDELSRFRPDLVLMDVLLPGANGVELVRFVRQDERFTTLPVVFMTTEVEIDTKIAMAKAGADDFLAKPVPPRSCSPRSRRASSARAS